MLEVMHNRKKDSMEVQEKIIKTGFTKYDNTTPYRVEIVETNFKPGSGDQDDSPEIQLNQYGYFYMIKYYSPPSFEFPAEGGWYDYLKETIFVSEKKTSGMIWES